MKRKAWVVAVDMGYGHWRAAYPFKDIAMDRIITANSDRLLTPREMRAWGAMRSSYEFMSRLITVPVLGKFLFSIYDHFQKIGDMYPFRDMSQATFPVLYCNYILRAKKLNKTMMQFMKRTGLPFITTYFFTAFAADYFGIDKVFCVVTDTDINRVWIPFNPKKSRIVYLAPCESVVLRLKRYGVSEDKIIMTGFPLPKENIGGKSMAILKKDLGNRLPNLDPKKRYPRYYNMLAKSILGPFYKTKSSRPFTLTIAVGGAGVHKKLVYQVLKSLKYKIREGAVHLNISTGTRTELLDYYLSKISELHLSDQLDKRIKFIFAWNKEAYFRNFNEALRNTDILWSKPSEMSFFAGLGIPIIIAPPVGAHEFRNQQWLVEMGAGFVQDKPEYTHEWLFDLLDSGKLAEAAMDGFIEAPKMGTYNIERIVFSRKRAGKQVKVRKAGKRAGKPKK